MTKTPSAPQQDSHYGEQIEHRAENRDRFIAIAIAIAVHLLLGLLFYYWIFKRPPEPIPEITVVGQPSRAGKVKKPTPQVEQPPTPPSAPSQMITSTAPATVQIPPVDMEASLDDFAPQVEFLEASTMDVSDEQAAAETTITTFGTTAGQPGDLIGRLYDVKQKPDRSQHRYELSDAERKDSYARAIKKIMRKIARKETSFGGEFYRAQSPLYFKQLAVPKMNADDGPRAFGADKEVKPGGWFIHYTGYIARQDRGRFRLAGIADDLLMVFINGKLVLNGSYDPMHEMGGFKSKEYFDQHHVPFLEKKLVYGDWFTIGNEAKRIDILFGERPGGELAGVLLCEDKKEKYRKDGAGRPVLPLFSLEELTQDQVYERSAKLSSFELDTRTVVFQGIQLQ